MKLNLGSGTDVREGFKNVDIRSVPGVDIVADATDLKVEFANECAAFIVAQHLLEYIPREQMVSTLKEWKRILKPAGLLEIRVTDLAEVVRSLYLNTISKEQGLHHEMILSLVYGRQANEYDVRYNGFTAEFLQGVLSGLGFKVINCVKEQYDIIVTAQK